MTLRGLIGPHAGEHVLDERDVALGFLHQQLEEQWQRARLMLRRDRMLRRRLMLRCGND
jgi:hypothetical protein